MPPRIAVATSLAHLAPRPMCPFSPVPIKLLEVAAQQLEQLREWRGNVRYGLSCAPLSRPTLQPQPQPRPLALRRPCSAPCHPDALARARKGD